MASDEYPRGDSHDLLRNLTGWRSARPPTAEESARLAEWYDAGMAEASEAEGCNMP